MTEVVHEGAIIATAVSEPGQDLTHPVTTATRTESGWRVDGAKIFCTMSPAATVLFTTVSFVDDEGRERYGYARIPASSPGVVIHDDWDALGMRASGSHSVTFDEVELPASALRGGFPVGSHEAYLESNLTAGLFHAAASLGIAEAAQIATRPLADRDLDARSQILVAEGAIGLGARAAQPVARRPRGRRGTSTPATAPSRRSSPRSRAPRRSSTRRPCASSTARSR